MKSIWALPVILALGGVQAEAADLPSGESNLSPAVVSSFDWSGYYIGVMAGYGIGSSEARGNPGFDGSAPNDIARLDPDGIIGGLVFGKNWQADSIVYGLEGEAGYLGAEDGFWFPNGADYFGRTEYGFYGSVAARLGYAMDRTLVTVKGGAILSQIEYGYGDIDGGVNGNIDPTANVADDIARFGLLVGASLEHGFFNDWIGRLDYSYANFDDHSEMDQDGDTYRISDDLHMIRAGVVKKF